MILKSLHHVNLVLCYNVTRGFNKLIRSNNQVTSIPILDSWRIQVAIGEHYRVDTCTMIKASCLSCAECRPEVDGSMMYHGHAKDLLIYYFEKSFQQ